MRVLAIDTSTMFGGVAVMDDRTGLIVEVRLNVKSTYSERLMTSIDFVLKQSGYTVSDMDVFAVSIGPGSFTGLRIGLSTVKGFSYATGKPIVSIPTLETIAWNFPFCKYPVCTLLDARKKEVYAALFVWKDSRLIRLIDEMSIGIKDLLVKIEENNPHFLKGGQTGDHSAGEAGGFSDKRVVFAGDGAILYREEIVNLIGEKAIFAPSEKMMPSPAQVAALGIKKALQGEFSEPISLVPLYIRKSEAEIKSDRMAGST